jgi:hypothetical protein
MPYRRGYRRRGYSRGRRRLRSSYRRNGQYSQLTRQLHVYNQPFSFSTNQPKIPDGKMQLSVGMKLQNVTELNIPTTGTNAGVIWVLLQPTLGSAMCWRHGGEVDDVNHKAHGLWSESSSPIDGNIFNVDSGDGGERIDSWRVVSQAMKFQLINNADENDGWFEAIRVSPLKDEGNWSLQSISTQPINADDFFLTAKDPKDYDSNMVEHATYFTGKLRDIHKYQFRLAPMNGDHDIRLGHNRMFIGVDETANVSTDQRVDLANSNSEGYDFIKNNIDITYDMILVKIHGRAGTDINGTKLLCHTVQNQEVSFNENSALHRFHTETLKNSNAVKYHSKRRRQGNTPAVDKHDTDTPMGGT